MSLHWMSLAMHALALDVTGYVKKQLDIEKELNRRRVLFGEFTAKTSGAAKRSPWSDRGHLGTVANAHLSEEEEDE